MRRNPVTRALVLAAGVSAVVLAIAGCGPSGDGEGDGGGSGDKAPYVIGFNEDLSGPISFSGLTNLAGVKTYIDYVNEQGGVNGHQLELVTLDHRADGATSVANYKQLVEDEGAIAVLGNSASGAWAATGPLGDQYKVPMLGYGNADDFFMEYTPFLFKNGIAAIQFAELEAQVLEDYVMKGETDNLKVAILAVDTASGPVHIEAVEEVAEQRGWEVVQTQLVGVGATDCSAQAAQIVASGAQAVLGNLTSVGEDLVCFQQLQQRGFDGPFVNTNSSAAENTHATLQNPNWIGLRTYTWWEDDSVEGIAELNERAAATGNAAQLGDFSSDGYVAAIVLVEALTQCGDECDGESVQQALEQLTNVDTKGIGGPALGFTTGALGHTIPQARAFQWDAEAGRSVAITDWLTVHGR